MKSDQRSAYQLTCRVQGAGCRVQTNKGISDLTPHHGERVQECCWLLKAEIGGNDDDEPGRWEEEDGRRSGPHASLEPCYGAGFRSDDPGEAAGGRCAVT